MVAPLKGGTIKSGNYYGTEIYQGFLSAQTKNYANYLSAGNPLFIGKGTLENVLTGKGLVKSTTISDTSTDDNVVTPKAVYDYIESLNIEEVDF